MISDEQKMGLINEFPELADEDLYLHKEVLAHFGLVFSRFALVEHSCINIVVFDKIGKLGRAGKIKSESIWQEEMDLAEQEAISLTFGHLVKLIEEIPEFHTVRGTLEKVRKIRNYLAHHHFREEAFIASDEAGQWHIILGFQEIRKELEDLEKSLQPCFKLMCKRHQIKLPTKDEEECLMQEMKCDALSNLEPGVTKFGWTHTNSSKNE